MDDRRMRSYLRDQAGLIARQQVLACGGDDNLIESLLRRREWSRVHPGVYVDHTAELPWAQRAWAALLYYWPAALCHESALRAHRLRSTGWPPGDVIHLAVDRGRRVQQVNGVRVHRVLNLGTLVQPNRAPARLRLEHSLLDVASNAPDDATAIAVLGDACQCGRTTPGRLLDVLRTRVRLPRRRFLIEVLDDIGAGAYSVLEHRYLLRVERPHGLPTAKRQRRVRQGRSAAYRDVEYLGHRTVVELDGRLGHEETLDRWDDMDRDIDSAVAGDTTIRLGWKHILDPCRTAAAVGRVLTAHGWSGPLKTCEGSCINQVCGAEPAPGAWDPPQRHAVAS